MVVSELGFQAWKDGAAILKWIGWPKNDLFNYDEAAYKRLTNLYQAGRKQELNQEWNKLKAFT